MRSPVSQPEIIRQYLLGQLSEVDQAQLEEQLLTDGAVYEELLIAEDELVDQYLRNELSAAEVQSVETHFLRAPERRKKLSFATALRKYVNGAVAGQAAEADAVAASPAAEAAVEPPRKWRLFSLLHIQSPVVGFGLATAMLLVLFGTAWIIIKNSGEPAPHDILTEVLAPGRTRGQEPANERKFAIPAGKDTVRLQLQLLADDHQVYRVVLEDLAGTIVMQKDNLKSQPVDGRPAVLFDVPAGKLSPNRYQVKVKGITAGGQEEGLGSYDFTVSK